MGSITPLIARHFCAFAIREEFPAQQERMEALLFWVPKNERALANAIDPRDAREVLGILYLRLKQPQRATEHWRALLRLEPNNAEAWAYLGWSLRQIGQRDDAISSFRKALSLDPALDSARRQLAELESR